MSVRQQICDALAALVASVDTDSSAAGTIHTRTRYAPGRQKFLDLFRGSRAQPEAVRGWWVSATGMESWQEGSAQGVPANLREFTVHGVMAFDDDADTESTFLDLVEGVYEAIEMARDLSLSAVLDYGLNVSLRQTEPRLFADMLVHYAEIVVTMPVRITRVYA